MPDSEQQEHILRDAPDRDAPLEAAVEEQGDEREWMATWADDHWALIDGGEHPPTGRERAVSVVPKSALTTERHRTQVAEGERDEARAEVERLRQVLGAGDERDLPPHDPPDEAYDLRLRLKRAIRWLREAEDIARIGKPAWPTADRIRDIYEQVTADVLNGKTSIPPIRQREAKLREALRPFAEIHPEADALKWKAGVLQAATAAARSALAASQEET